MTYISCLIGLVFGLIFFIACIKAYAIGLKHGKQIACGNVPEVKIMPELKKETEPEPNPIVEGINNVLNFNPYNKVGE